MALSGAEDPAIALSGAEDPAAEREGLQEPEVVLLSTVGLSSEQNPEVGSSAYCHLGSVFDDVKHIKD